MANSNNLVTSINVNMRICSFLWFTNLLHAEFGKFYNFIWKMAIFKQFGNVHYGQLYSHAKLQGVMCIFNHIEVP